MALLAVGAAFSRDAVLATGWIALLAAATLLAVNLLASLRSAVRPLALPARLLALAQAFLPAGLLVALIATLEIGATAPFTGPAGAAIAVLLLAGWIGLTVAGSLLHLLAILARIRNFTLPMPRPRPLRDRTLTATAGAGVAALALSRAPGLALLGAPAAAVTAAVAGLLAIRVLALALRAARPMAS
jgi:hypothetical protein